MRDTYGLRRKDVFVHHTNWSKPLDLIVEEYKVSAISARQISSSAHLRPLIKKANSLFLAEIPLIRPILPRDPCGNVTLIHLPIPDSRVERYMSACVV